MPQPYENRYKRLQCSQLLTRHSPRRIVTYVEIPLDKSL